MQLPLWDLLDTPLIVPIVVQKDDKGAGEGEGEGGWLRFKLHAHLDQTATGTAATVGAAAGQSNGLARLEKTFWAHTKSICFIYCRTRDMTLRHNEI